MFLILDGIQGESKDKVHAKAIDVLAWSWGMSQSGTFHTGMGGGAGKASFQDISITKWVDNSTATLMNKIAQGGHVATAKLVVRKAGGDNPLEYVVIDMQQVMITSLSTGGSGGEDQLTENITLNFAKVKTTYTGQTDTGGKGTAVEFKWNIPENVSA